MKLRKNRIHGEKMLLCVPLILLLTGCAGNTVSKEREATLELASEESGSGIQTIKAGTRTERDENLPIETGSSSSERNEETSGQASMVAYPRNLAAYLWPELKWEMGGELQPADFFDLETLQEEQKLTKEDLKELAFAEKPSEEELHTEGRYEVKIAAGNRILDAHLKVCDTTPPVISVPQSMEYHVGETIAYKKNMSVSDNSGEELTVEIDSSAVYYNIPGEYVVKYLARDSSGNLGQATSTIIILPEHEATEEETKQLAEELLQSILTDGMDKLQQARAIFDWCHQNIRNTAKARKDGIWQGAYDGLYYKMGDCYTFYATSAYLLDLCGIENLAVSHRYEKNTHYWNLVNTGNGWYHFDCAPHVGGYECFMQTEEQVKVYIENSSLTEAYFQFDQTDMPSLATEILVPDE